MGKTRNNIRWTCERYAWVYHQRKTRSAQDVAHELGIGVKRMWQIDQRNEYVARWKPTLLDVVKHPRA